MAIILLHSSKTMKQPARSLTSHQLPMLESQAEELAVGLKKLSIQDIKDAMTVSSKKAADVYRTIQAWSPDQPLLPAIDIFLGDIYSGLQASSLTQADRDYANTHLFILSGLYGILRALDTIQPYRLEMGYKLPTVPSIYSFWGDAIAKVLPARQPIINLSAKEYTKAILPYLNNIPGQEGAVVISPKFLTLSAKTGEPTFVTVHAKIARGAYARWIIKERIEDLTQLKAFHELGYQYDATLSTAHEPVFVAKEFGGLGLSVRLSS